MTKEDVLQNLEWAKGAVAGVYALVDPATNKAEAEEFGLSDYHIEELFKALEEVDMALAGLVNDIEDPE